MELSDNFVITETDQSTHRCTALLVNFLFHTRRFAIGQSITSQIFEMSCPRIGKSRWTLIVFPAGQYEFESDNGQLSVYLKMLGCENENEKMFADVEFSIESEDRISKVVQGRTFHYKNNRTRWVGTDLTSKPEFYSRVSRGYLLRDNHLVIGCRMIHSDLMNVQTRDIRLKQKQTLTIEDEYGNSLEIDVSPKPYSSPSSFHANGTEYSLKDDSRTTPTLPSTS